MTAANGYYFVGNATGAFTSAGYMSKRNANAVTEISSVDPGYGGFNLNAQSFNPLYGSAETVQPSAMYAMCLIRSY